MSNLLGLLKHPSKISDSLGYIHDDLRTLCHSSIGGAHYWYYYKQSETNIIDKDWDNLILLDACRHDMLQSVTDREIEQIISVAGRSSGFIEKTMNGKELYDTVYISSNPHVEMTLDKGVFHDIVKTYGDKWQDQRNAHEKFHPENVYDIAKRALVNRWTALVSTVRTRKMKRETVDVHVENFPLHEQSRSVS